MKLKVQQATREDVYRDIVRVSERYRLDTHGEVVPEGSVCRIVVPGRSAYVILRGLGSFSEQLISMDERLRNLLHLSEGDDVEIQLKTAGSGVSFGGLGMHLTRPIGWRLDWLYCQLFLVLLG